MSDATLPQAEPAPDVNAAPTPGPEETTQVAFDPEKMGANFTPPPPPPPHIEFIFDHANGLVHCKRDGILQDSQPMPEGMKRPEPVISAQGTTTTTVPYLPNGVVIDWIDPTVNVKVQVVRWKDYLVYDPTDKTFKAEASAANQGLIPLARPLAGLRNAYQVYEMFTPADVFNDGTYRIFYYDDTNKLLDVGPFAVYKGVPFYEYGFPQNSIPVPPSVAEIAAGMPAPPTLAQIATLIPRNPVVS